MCSRVRSRSQQRLFFLGIALLAIGNSTRFFLQHTHRIREDRADGVWGLLMGVAIGVLILMLYRHRRSS